MISNINSSIVPKNSCKKQQKQKTKTTNFKGQIALKSSGEFLTDDFYNFFTKVQDILNTKGIKTTYENGNDSIDKDLKNTHILHFDKKFNTIAKEVFKRMIPKLYEIKFIE